MISAPQNDESQNVARIEWNREDLPPVGTICGVDVSGIWHKCTLLAHCLAPKLGFAVGQISAGLAIGEASDFRPIRTPEQIAADDREKARDEVLNLMAQNAGLENEELWQLRLKIVGEMLDMGFRKP